MDGISPVERKIRAGLPVVRFMQTSLPLPAAEWLLKRGVARVRLDGAVSRQTISAGGVPCEWLVPSNSPADQVLLYLHGGGFVFGMTPLHLQMGAYLAQKMNMRILMVDYRTAPAAPFPAALDDCLAAYHWLLSQGIPAQNIAIAGDSAGGNLTITSLFRLRDSGEALPAAAVCLSPVVDLTGKNEQPQAFKDPLLSPKATRRYREAYVANNDARNPLISPVFGDLHGLPPLLIHVGEDEILRDEAVQIARLAESAGVDVRLEIYPRMWHVWQIFLELPQAIQSLDDIAKFITAHLQPARQLSQ